MVLLLGRAAAVAQVDCRCAPAVGRRISTSHTGAASPSSIKVRLLNGLAFAAAPLCGLKGR